MKQFSFEKNLDVRYKEFLNQEKITNPLEIFKSLVGKDVAEHLRGPTPIDISREQQKQNEETTVRASTNNKWSKNGNVYFLAENVVDTLELGFYDCCMTWSGTPFVVKKNFQTDELMVLPDDATETVIKHIEEFWSLREKFKEFGFLHKRGVILWGPPAGGKTSTVFQTVKQVIGRDGIALLASSPSVTLANIENIRAVQPDVPIVCVFEDIDETIAWYGDKTLTMMLDGESNVDNVLFLATTNYPQRLPPRIINRPSRFDVVEYIGYPSAEARKAYLKEKTKKLKVAPTVIDSWVSKTDGLSIAALKELLIMVLAYNKPVDDAIARLKGMANMPFARANERGYGIDITVKTEQAEIKPILNMAPIIPTPVVNVTVPEAKSTKVIKTVKRDPAGNIEQMVEETIKVQDSPKIEEISQRSE